MLKLNVLFSVGIQGSIRYCISATLNAFNNKEQTEGKRFLKGQAFSGLHRHNADKNINQNAAIFVVVT